MSSVAVIGPGLMGGSLLRARSEAGLESVVWGPDPAERAAAGALPGVRVSPGLDEALDGVTGVVLATPLSALGEILDRIVAASGLPWVTDVASLQRPPLEAAADRGLGDRYVSSHPMAGGHRSGFAASTPELYRHARVWLSASSTAAPVPEVSDFWRALDAEPAGVEADEHDRRMAWASHLPQVVSTHLAALLSDTGVPRADLGPGGRDVTRLAGSDPRMWTDILEAAPTPLPQALRTLARRLTEEADHLERGTAAPFAELLRATRGWSRA